MPPQTMVDAAAILDIITGRRGGKAQVAKLSKEGLAATSRKAAQARWAKEKKGGAKNG